MIRVGRVDALGRLMDSQASSYCTGHRHLTKEVTFDRLRRPTNPQRTSSGRALIVIHMQPMLPLASTRSALWPGQAPTVAMTAKITPAHAASRP